MSRKGPKIVTPKPYYSCRGCDYEEAAVGMCSCYVYCTYYGSGICPRKSMDGTYPETPKWCPLQKGWGKTECKNCGTFNPNKSKNEDCKKCGAKL